MAGVRESSVMERMRTTFELFDVAVRMMRENLRRADPSATEAVIDERLGQWLRSSPLPGGPGFRPGKRVFD